MKAKDVMTFPVVSVGPDTGIREAIRLMLQHRISGLPVVDSNRKVVGIVTEGDFLRRSETGTERHRAHWLQLLTSAGRLADEYTHTHGRKISDVMAADPVVVSEDTPLEEVVRLMERHAIKRVPVVRGGELVGIVSRANLLHALASVVSEVTPALESDEAIRDALLTELRKQDWAPLALIDISVRNGIVELWGTITDERQRQALVVAAGAIPGVKAVKDHLAWVEPMSGMVVYGADDEPAKASS